MATTHHVYLCSTCGHSVGRALGKKCPVCRNKTMIYFSDNRSPEYLKKSRQIRKERNVSTPMQANMLITVLVAAFLGLGALGIRYYADWSKSKDTEMAKATIGPGAVSTQNDGARIPVATGSGSSVH